ncbi:MAG: tetratricopeptide repeat protein, partial [Planctomycetes bacterium]|nr:tetratricopeptide repeat protein [Planctomycetota bacterium]
TPEEPWALVSRARLARIRGELGLAETLSRRALTTARRMLPARLELVDSLRAQGYGREAANEAGAFPQRLTAFIDAESGRLRDDVSLAVLLDLARGCALYGLSAGRPAALKLAVQDLYPEARRRDPGEVRGYVEPAGLLLARYNVREARALYEEALDLNPNHPEAHLGLARCHWQAGQREDARFRAERTLATNPHHPGAHALLARIDLAVGRLDSAREHVGRALATNPHLGEAQALGMVLRLVEGDLPEDLPGELTTLPTPAQARVYRELGSWLSDHRRYGEAELQFQRALLVSPQDPEVTAGLGLCYFRWGKEDRARKTLDQAFQLDSFNVRVFNALEVLDALSEYTERRGEHLIVRSPPETAFLAEYVAAFGEEVLGHLLEQFGVEPREPVVVELLPSRDLFSARVTGLPGLDLNAACLGQVVAVGPTTAERPFNWYDALVHELTHAVCYLVAQGRAPQWLEEG